jgi:hypothetical protein
MDNNMSGTDPLDPKTQSIEDSEIQNSEDHESKSQAESEVLLSETEEIDKTSAEIIDVPKNLDTGIEMVQDIETSQSLEPETPSINYQEEIEKLLVERELIASESVLLTEQVEIQEVIAKSLNQWVGEQKSSFLWKILNQMSLNKIAVQAKLDEYQEFINKLDVPESGMLAQIRKRFHKSLLISWSVILLIAVVLVSLPQISKRLPEIQGLSRFVSSVDYPSNLDVALNAVYLMLIILISLLIQYYRDWSKFERRITLSLWKLDEISKNVKHCRNEQARLLVLYPQVKDWLEIIGNSLNKPWDIDEKWLESNFNDIPQNDFPFAMRIAQAQEDDNASSTNLKRGAAERHLTRGWRSKAFEDQVLVAGELMGMSSERLNLEILDADIALSPGGPRSILKDKIGDPELLKLVAKRQLLPLMKILQVELIPGSRPPVKENRTDLLDEFQPEELGLELNQRLAWDQFLSISMGDIDKPRTPLSQLAFSETGRQVGHHDRAKTIFIAPNRLISKVPNNETTVTDSYGESTRLPLDIVVRMDITGPLQQDDVLILKRSDEEVLMARSTYEKTILENTQSHRRGV